MGNRFALLTMVLGLAVACSSQTFSESNARWVGAKEGNYLHSTNWVGDPGTASRIDLASSITIVRGDVHVLGGQTMVIRDGVLRVSTGAQLRNSGRIILERGALIIDSESDLINLGSIGGTGTVSTSCDSSVPPPGIIDESVTVVVCAVDCDPATECCDEPEEPAGCTLTQGYWKNHDVWPAGTSHSDTLCGLTYDAILATPVKRSVWTNLAHQYIAAVLNRAAGASAPPQVKAALDEAEVLLTSNCGEISAIEKAMAVGIKDVLDDYNNGLTGPGHCPEAEEPVLE